MSNYPDPMRSPEVPWWEIISLRNHYRIMNSFVETGTGMGVTSATAAGLFQRVFTVEIDPAMYRRADKELAPHKNVTRYLGDSVSVLPKIMDELGDKAMWWIDSHWCGGPRVGNVECPLLDELRLINSRGSATDCLFIDNIGLMTMPPYTPHKQDEWPTIAQVVAVLQENPKWHITRLCDCLIATPDPITEIY